MGNPFRDIRNGFRWIDQKISRPFWSALNVPSTSDDETPLPDFAENNIPSAERARPLSKPLPIIYGTRKVSGLIVYRNTTDTLTTLSLPPARQGSITEGTHTYQAYLDTCIAFASGINTDIEYLVFDEEENIIVGDYEGSATFVKALGTNSTIFPEAARFDDLDQRFKGMAVTYAWLTLFYDQEEPIWEDIPEVSAIIKGRPVFDPRSEANHISPDDGGNPTDWDYSENPALCLLDYLISQDTMNIPLANIDIESFKASADYLDVTVANPSKPVATADGSWYNTLTGETVNYVIGDVLPWFRRTDLGTQRRSSCNLVIEGDTSHASAVQSLASACLGVLTWQNGKFRLVVDEGESVYTFNETNIAPDLDIGTLDLYSLSAQHTVRFPDKDKNYEYNQVTYPHQNAADYVEVQSAVGLIKNKQYTFDYCTDFFQAYNQARRGVNDALNAKRVKIQPLAGTALLLQIGDRVTLDLMNIADLEGASDYIIEEISLDIDLINIKSMYLRPYDSNKLDWQTGIEAIVPLPSERSSKSSPTISNLQATFVYFRQPDGTFGAGVNVEWDPPTDYFSLYEVQWKKNQNMNWNTTPAIKSNYQTITGLQGAQTYFIRVRVQNKYGGYNQAYQQATINIPTLPDENNAQQTTGGSYSLNYQANVTSATSFNITKNEIFGTAFQTVKTFTLPIPIQLNHDYQIDADLTAHSITNATSSAFPISGVTTNDPDATVSVSRRVANKEFNYRWVANIGQVNEKVVKSGNFTVNSIDADLQSNISLEASVTNDRAIISLTLQVNVNPTTITKNTFITYQDGEPHYTYRWNLFIPWDLSISSSIIKVTDLGTQ